MQGEILISFSMEKGKNESKLKGRSFDIEGRGEAWKISKYLFSPYKRLKIFIFLHLYIHKNVQAQCSDHSDLNVSITSSRSKY